MSPGRNQFFKIALAALAVCALVGILIFQRPPAIQLPPAKPLETLRHDLVQSNGLWYRNGETKPFNGLMADYNTNGARLALCCISNGMANGLCETWYTNGQIQVRENFKDGVSAVSYTHLTLPTIYSV